MRRSVSRPHAEQCPGRPYIASHPAQHMDASLYRGSAAGQGMIEIPLPAVRTAAGAAQLPERLLSCCQDCCCFAAAVRPHQSSRSRLNCPSWTQRMAAHCLSCPSSVSLVDDHSADLVDIPQLSYIAGIYMHKLSYRGVVANPALHKVMQSGRHPVWHYA